LGPFLRSADGTGENSALYNGLIRSYAGNMNNVQLYIMVGLPTLTVLVGMFLNQRAFDRLESSLGSRMDRLEARLDRIEADLREFYRTLGQHDARLDNLEKRLTQRA
jgi:hypothetical protein